MQKTKEKKEKSLIFCQHLSALLEIQNFSVEIKHLMKVVKISMVRFLRISIQFILEFAFRFRNRIENLF
jgi:hypothetical protein